MFEWLAEGIGSTRKICSDYEGEADGDPLDQYYLLVLHGCNLPKFGIFQSIRENSLSSLFICLYF